MAYLQRVKIATSGGATYHNLGKFLYGTCETPANTAAKVVTCAALGTLEDGVTVFVKFTYGSGTGYPSLNINGTGAYLVSYNGSGSITPGTDNPAWIDGSVVAFTFNGEYWVVNHSVQAAVKKDVSITIQAGTTTHAVSDSWITEDTSCYAHNLETKGITKSISWVFASGAVTFTLDGALSSDLTFSFGMIKNIFV